MPAHDDEKLGSTESPEMSIEGAAASQDDDLQIPAPSEVAMRLNLLGKLIIPPAPR